MAPPRPRSSKRLTKILRFKPDWRGTLNDAGLRRAQRFMYQRAKNHPEEWLINRIFRQPADDKYLGALRWTTHAVRWGEAG